MENPKKQFCMGQIHIQNRGHIDGTMMWIRRWELLINNKKKKKSSK